MSREPKNKISKVFKAEFFIDRLSEKKPMSFSDFFVKNFKDLKVHPKYRVTIEAISGDK